MATLPEAYKEIPLALKHIIPLDFKSIDSVPDSHAWPKTNINNDIHVQSENIFDEKSISIPVVDLMAPNVEETIGGACQTWGVFRLINHGIPANLVEEVEFQTARLFALPSELKMKVLRSPGGATGYGAPRITPFFPKFMWHEGFTIIGSPLGHARELWPHDYQHFCDVMENYQKQMKALAYKILILMLKSIGVSEEELNWKSSSSSSSSSMAAESESALQLNSFPTCPDPTIAIGLADHTDSMLFTILHQSPTKGLQIFKDGIGWITVPPVAGPFVVNTGDLLHIYSYEQKQRRTLMLNPIKFDEKLPKIDIPKPAILMVETGNRRQRSSSSGGKGTSGDNSAKRGERRKTEREEKMENRSDAERRREEEAMAVA